MAIRKKFLVKTILVVTIGTYNSLLAIGIIVSLSTFGTY